MGLSPTRFCVIFALAVVPVKQAWSQSEACCLPDDTCIDADPISCSTLSGTSIVGACFAGLSTCCFPGGTCAALDGNCCRLEGGTILPGEVCDTRPCCSANDTANACEIRDVCSCVEAGGTPAQSGGTCPDCCAVQSGSLSEPPPTFNNEADLCAAFHGFPIFQDLIPPMAPDDVYAAELARFLRNGSYRQLGWLRDLRIRPFGNYQGVPPDDNDFNLHSHPGLRLYYSPEIIEWLCNSRQARCISNGSFCTTNVDCPSADTCELLKPQAMIVAEIRPYTSINKDPDMRCREDHTVCTTNADCPVGDECLDNIIWLNDSCYDDAPSSWAVMASGLPNGILPGGPPDNWFWLEEDSAGAQFGYNMSSCIGCHASAPGTSTFANLRNILDEEILYQHIEEFCGDGVVNDAPNEQCDDGNNDDGDGCSFDCLIESGGVPILPQLGLILFAMLLLGTSFWLIQRRLRFRT